MASRGKNYRDVLTKVEHKPYALPDAIKKAKEVSYSTFPASIELHFAMVLPKDKEAKSIKGSLSLPHPIKTEEVHIIVFCEKDDIDAAKNAGAIEAGLDDLIKKVQDGWSDFDVALAKPSVMGQIAVLGKQLGPKGLMPNPKTGTLTTDIVQSIGEFKKGKTKFASDAGGVVHIVVGKADVDNEKIAENINAALTAIADTLNKPLPTLVKSITLSPTMGPSVNVDSETL